MRRLCRLRPSPAMIVASLALLVGLAGTSVAAVNALPSSSVGTLQLKNNAVISAKVKSHSLLRSDFANGQLPRGPQGPQGPQGPSGPAGPAGAAGVATPGYIAQVLTQTGNTPITTNATSYNDLPNSAQTVTVPTGQTAKLIVYFSAETACSGGVGAQGCLVRATVDGTELAPTATTPVFDSNENGTATTNYRAAHSIARVSATLNAGAHTVKIQGRTTSPLTTLRLDAWTVVIDVQRVT